MIPLHHYLILSALVFCIGLYGLFTRRSAIGILLSLEIMLNAANINFVAFSKFVTPDNPIGQIFVIFTIGVSAASAVVGLAIIVAIYRNYKTIFVDEIDIMKW